MVADWRQIARKNNKKTYGAFVSFLLVYLLLGALVAVLFHPYPSTSNWLPILMSSHGQNTMGVFMCFCLLAIGVAIFFGGKFSLSGLNATVIGPDNQNSEYQKLYHVVEEMKIASGMPHMPTVYVINADYMNAFAAGWHPKNAIVAITEPLLSILTREELQAVMAHELAHIRQRDTRVMTLVSVLSGLSIWIIDTLFRSIIYGGVNGRRGRRNERSGGPLIIIVMALRVILPILTAFLVMYVSRSREMLADSGSVEMTRNSRALATALCKIHNAHHDDPENTRRAYESTAHNSLRSLAYMYDPGTAGVSDYRDINSWFKTHPTLKQRLQALGELDLIE